MAWYQCHHMASLDHNELKHNFLKPKHRQLHFQVLPSWIWIWDVNLTLFAMQMCKNVWPLLPHNINMVFDSQHIYLDIIVKTRFSLMQMIIQFVWKVSSLALTQRAHDAIMSFWCQNDVATLFWRKDIIIALCACWGASHNCNLVLPFL